MTKSYFDRNDESFIFKQIRKYNSVRTQIHQDAVLTAVGVRVSLIDKKKLIVRKLTAEERQRVVYFLRQFLNAQGLKCEIKEPVQ